MHRTLPCAILYLWERAATKGEDHDRSERWQPRAELERKLIQRSLEDGAFRQRLLDDPRAAAARERCV